MLLCAFNLYSDECYLHLFLKETTSYISFEILFYCFKLEEHKSVFFMILNVSET